VRRLDHAFVSPERRAYRQWWEARRFPPPWSVEETDACFIVRDANGLALAYVYFEEEPGRRSAAPPNDHHDALTSYRVGGIPVVAVARSVEL
jgi:hypothetical protein